MKTLDVPYRPTHRRPIANLFRRTADRAVRWCVDHDLHPDTISYASLLFAALASACFLFATTHPWLLFPAVLLIYGRLWFNMLDGMVALASGKASPRGEILNELPDRGSDVLIFLGVAHSGLAQMPLAYWALISALLVAYVGTLGQAVGAGRQYGGWMSKPWRMVTLHLGAWITWWQITNGFLDLEVLPTGRSALDLACWLVLVGSLSTLVTRLRSTFQSLPSS